MFRKVLWFVLCLLFLSVLNSAHASLEDDSNIIFNWVEQKYSQFFTPEGQSTQAIGIWYYRYYPSTGVYVGVNNKKQVYVLGGKLGQTPLYVGTVSDFLKIIAAQSDQHLFINPMKVVVDNQRNRALIVDESSGILFAVNLSNGTQSIFSDSSDSSGPNAITPITRPRDIKLDAANNRLLVAGLSGNSHSLLSVNLDTGVRSVLIDDSTPDEGLDDFSIDSFVLDQGRNRVLFGGRKEIISIDLSTGVSTSFANNNNVADAQLKISGNVTAMIIDHPNNRVFAGDDYRIWEIDLNTGTRKLFIENIVDDNSFQIDYTKNQLLVADASNIYAINLGDRQRTIITENSSLNAANPLFQADGIALDSSSNRILVVDREINALLAVDLSSGVRIILANNSVPNNQNPFTLPLAIEMDSNNNRLLVLDTENISAVNMTTGARTRLNSPSLLTTTFDTNNNRILGIDVENQVMAADLNTGAKTKISGSPVSNDLRTSGIMAIDSNNGRLLAVDNTLTGIISIDLTNGNRVLFSNETIPSQDLPFSQIEDIIIDSANNRALVLDEGDEVIVSVNLSTGARTLLSDVSRYLTGDGTLVLDTANQRILMTDEFLPGAIYAINITSGAITIFADKETPNSINVLSEPIDITIDSKNNQAYVLDIDWGGIVKIDLQSGTRKPFSLARVVESD